MNIVGLNIKTGEEKNFNSIQEAQKMVGNKGTVKRCLDGKIKTTKGWLFRYEGEDFHENTKKMTNNNIKVFVISKGDEEIKLPLEMLCNLYGLSKSEITTVAKGYKGNMYRKTVKGYLVREATEEETKDVLSSISYIDYVKTISIKKEKEYPISIGEKIIKDILDYNKVKYVREYTLKNSIQRMDFYVELDNNHKYCIEHQGQQHYRGWNVSLEKQQELDNNKKKYCRDNDIEYVEIKYNTTILGTFELLKSLGIVTKRPSVFTFYNNIELDIDDVIEKYQYMDRYQLSEYYDIPINDLINAITLIGRNLKRKFKNK